MRHKFCIFLFLLNLPFISTDPCIAAPLINQRSYIEPEEMTVEDKGTLKVAADFMISTSSPEASEAGSRILQQGGSAIDAAIAAQLVLGLVEPQSSGLGGGAFLLHWEKEKGELITFDGRETAPIQAKSDRFLINGKPMRFPQAMRSGLSVGTPGVVKLLWETHQIYGKLPWDRLFVEAIQLANNGFRISKRLNLLLITVGPNVFDDTARAYFFTDKGLPHPPGFILKNPEYASTLKTLAEFGAEEFYKGSISKEIVSAVARSPNIKGDLSAEDMSNYKIETRAPICTKYRSFKICSMPPPSSGGIFLNQTLQILEGFNLGSRPQDALNIKALHLIAEAEKLAYADRNKYLADPKYVSIPPFLTDLNYIAERQQLIRINRAMSDPKPGAPAQHSKYNFGKDATIESSGTSHISVIDKYGNAVSMTTTIEGVFGSGLMASGFLLNNELTDFSFLPVDQDGILLANRVEAGKRPRSSMSPTLIFDAKNKLVGVLGSPGGSRILIYVLKALIGLIDWELNAYEAANLPNFGSTGQLFELEYSWYTVPSALSLITYGHRIKTDTMNSGLNILRMHGGLIEGGSDPRRGGSALGK